MHDPAGLGEGGPRGLDFPKEKLGSFLVSASLPMNLQKQKRRGKENVFFFLVAHFFLFSIR